MKFQYTEKKVSLPTNVHAYAEKKVMKLERYFGNDAEALVAFSVEKKLNKVEMDELADTDCQTLSNYYRMRKLDPVMDPAERAVYARKVEDIDVLEYILSKTDLSLEKRCTIKKSIKCHFEIGKIISSSVKHSNMT